MFGSMIVVLGLAVAPSAGPASAPAGMELPSDVRAVVDQLLEDMQQQWYMFSGVLDPAVGLRRVEEAAQRFDQGLQKLAQVGSPELGDYARKAEAREIRAKLIVIAMDHAEHPELYAEIDDKYIHFVVDQQARVPDAPFPDATHLHEKYRLVWEYWLLRPGCDSLLQGHGYERVLYAIQRIGKPSSLLSLEHCYLLTCLNVASPRQVQTSQLYLLRSLAGFKTEDSLRTVLRCLVKSENLPYRNDPDYKMRWRWDDGGPAEHVARLISEPPVRAQWQKVLKGMDRSALPDSELRALDRLEHIAASRPAP